ncbi:hypothetical protein FXB41_11235 [Bradyrhizobium canariense]|uniref:FUSC family protein n=1 Tax=Bradyrhizobium canariense TaxID=255045 RepID=UPI001CA5C5FA|nr:FUSC family protein [Bradyrhizobium canariense]MBW5435330.1 hypothetical protein [Bradyrhizobium canariense]
MTRIEKRQAIDAHSTGAMRSIAEHMAGGRRRHRRCAFGVGRLGKTIRPSQPLFASVIAVVALGPGIASHREQAWGLVVGVATGIIIGELVRFVPYPAVAMVIGVFVSMMIAACFALGPVVPIRAGVSLLLVLTLGAETAGLVRLIDVVIGAIVGLLCGRLFLKLPAPQPNSATSR